jgi:membrane-associated protein
MVGFFLPGDYLIFISGVLAKEMNVHIITLIVLLSLAATVGNITGYLFGRKTGPSLFNKDDNRIFKKRYIETARSFYNRNGGKALVLGRFLPIVRTFAPILAGVIKMDFRIFFFYSVAGAVLWIGSLCTAGFYLGKIQWVRNNIEWIIIGLIIVTAIPIITTYYKEKKKQNTGER